MTNYQFIRSLKWRLFRNANKLTQLQKKLGYFFSNQDYLIQALTHKSMYQLSSKNYERLEFLGDAIIDYIISEKLIKEFPEGDEGLLTNRRSSLVRKSFLAKMGGLLNLLDYLIAKPSVDYSQTKVAENQLENIFEALMGGIYLDGGIKACKRLIDNTIWAYRREAWKKINYKGLLIEYCHSKQLASPKFLVINTTGPDHEKLYEISVLIGKKKFPPGIGEDKKTAEQAAAQLTIDSLVEK